MRNVSIPASRVTVDLGQGPEDVAVESWQVSRALSGGGVPGQARAASGSSVGTGSVTLQDPLARTPWHDPATTPGGTVAIDAADDLESVVDGGAAFYPVARMRSRVVDGPSWVSDIRQLNLEDAFPQSPVHIPALLTPGTLDTSAIIDTAARSGGYYSTRPPTHLTVASWPLVGSLWNETGAGEVFVPANQGARYKTIEGRAMLVDTADLTFRVGASYENETPAAGTVVSFDVAVPSEGDVELYFDSSAGELIRVAVDEHNLYVETVLDSHSWAIPFLDSVQRMEFLSTGGGTWRIFVNGDYLDQVSNGGAGGLTTMWGGVTGGAALGAVRVEMEDAPRLAPGTIVPQASGNPPTQTTMTAPDDVQGVVVFSSAAYDHAEVTINGEVIPSVVSADAVGAASTSRISYLPWTLPGVHTINVGSTTGPPGAESAVYIAFIRGSRGVYLRDTANLGANSANPSVTVSGFRYVLSLGNLRRTDAPTLPTPYSSQVMVHGAGSFRVDMRRDSVGTAFAYTAPAEPFALTAIALAYVPETFEPTALISVSDSPIQAAVGGISGRSWDVIQDAASATLGAAWIDESGRLVYRGRNEMRSSPATEEIDAIDTLEDVPWSSGLDEVADRVEVTYNKPVVSRVDDSSLTVWESGTVVTLTRQQTVIIEEDLSGVAAELAWWERAGDTEFFPEHQKSRYAAWTAPPGQDGVQPPVGALEFEATLLSPNRVRIRIHNTTNSNLYVYRMVLRANVFAVPGQPITISSGVNEAASNSPLKVDLRTYVQDDTTAQRVLKWLTTQVSRPRPTIRSVRVVPDMRRRLGDVAFLNIRPISGQDTVRIKTMITGITTSASEGLLTQTLSFTVLSLTIADFNAAWSSASTIADFNAAWSGRIIADFNDNPLGA